MLALPTLTTGTTAASTSSFKIVPIAVVLLGVALVTLLRVMAKVSSGSTVVSPLIVTGKLPVSCPAAIVTVPFATAT